MTTEGERGPEVPEAFLPGLWRDEFQTLPRKMEALRARFRRLPLNVLVWGPGQHTSYYTKRQEIRQHLTAVNEHNHTSTSEELTASGNAEFVGLSLYDIEELHWRQADAVIALIPDDKAISGVRAEVAMFGRDPSFRRKLCLIVPQLSRADQERLGFLDQGWRDLPDSRRFAYKPREYRDCRKIREFCTSFVDSLRNQRALERERSGGGDH